jgi:hypothetical protein
LGGLAWPGGPFLSNGELSVLSAHSKQAWPGLSEACALARRCGMQSYHTAVIYIF